MSLLPLKAGDGETTWYGGDHNVENQNTSDETTLLVGRPGKPRHVEYEVAEVVLALFLMERTLEPGIIYSSGNGDHLRNKSNPSTPPEKRFARHRNFYIWKLNQFRHWWKTSRLLVRLSGAFEYCYNPVNWGAMATYDVVKRKQLKMAARAEKAIGRGGPSSDFLNLVKPFTRSIRIILAVARAWEARVDNRLYEVGVAEAFAFMGNRCARFVARHIADSATRRIALPFSGAFIAPYLEQQSRPIIVLMGIIRAVLPFMFSFIGSAIGRQLTFNTYKLANYRWQPVQSIMNFHQKQGVYADTVLDPELEEIAHKVAVAIGHGSDPEATRANLSAMLGFDVVGSGHGGLAVYRSFDLQDVEKVFLLYITPYGPSLLGEMPRYIVLERRRRFFNFHATAKENKFGKRESSDSTILDAALPCEASVNGFTYSGAFFKSQEWAALSSRYDEESFAYHRACNRLGTQRYVRKGTDVLHGPPTDLYSLKQFIRSSHLGRKMKKDKSRWSQVQNEVQKLAKMMSGYQKQGLAPKRIILYLEGLDCSGKSSTAGLVCQALEECGFGVKISQHNRPPTPEQRRKPWMDRGRFEYPDDMYEKGEEVPEYAALLWDRGPCGDHVYASRKDILADYEEFREYDAKCREEGVLFCKFLFVASKDSIASTLGKRLAHKKMATDLKTWLDANSIEHAREGLDEIVLHIDPTDFVAFNNYWGNLAKFAQFALNTDAIRPIVNEDGQVVAYPNPWTVVNTTKRHDARMGLLKSFESQLQRYAAAQKGKVPGYDVCRGLCKPKHEKLSRTESQHVGLVNGYVEERDKGISFRAVLQSLVLAGLLYFYAYITWKFDATEYA